MPSREDILNYVERESERGAKIGKREIARAFAVKGADRIGLKALLKDMEAQGLLDRRRKALSGGGALPATLVAVISGTTADGELFATPVDWDSQTQAPAPRILIHLPRRSREAAPGRGDNVLLHIEKSRGERDFPYLGRIIKVIPKERIRTLGILRMQKDGSARLIPIDKKAQGRELSIAAADLDDARDGDLVAVTVLDLARGRQGLAKVQGLSRARVRERLGSIGSEKAVSLIALYAHGIPHAFSPAALAEAARARPARLEGRDDWRSLSLVTIDPPDAKDHDDAVHARADDDPRNPGGFVLSIAIADVAAYVHPGSALDREALERGNSVYFPDRVVPMLPERISNDLCSLRPFEDRPALALTVTIDAQGRKLHHSFHRVMMRSAAKLAYAQAQAAIDGAPDDTTGALLTDVIAPLYAAYGALKKGRSERQPLDLELPERKLLLKPDGTLDRVVVPPRLEAHRLIEEFMILANVCAAETLERAHSPLLYRVHDEPSAEKLEGLREVLASVGIKLPKHGAMRPGVFNTILARVQGTPHQAFINEVVLRTQAQAEYAPENYGHFGLNLRRYAHFTSPIRRYADLIVHRGLIRALHLGKDGLPPSMTIAALAEIGAHISAAERRAMAAERDTVDRLIAAHLADEIGTVFEARINGVTRAGLFVSLTETGASGFIPAATLGGEYFRYRQAEHALVGDRSGTTFRLGDLVSVRLVEAAPIAGALRFELLMNGAFSRHRRQGGPRESRGRGHAGQRRNR
ncbi:MAG: ribonuclease R [Hyphomicrobiales bacterium]|nr:ribonuclease R [Hyphomicrobiales bacterium]MBV9521051.1 ribonuclease R [Hyphomicrobiales bacterium]